MRSVDKVVKEVLGRGFNDKGYIFLDRDELNKLIKVFKEGREQCQ